MWAGLMDETDKQIDSCMYNPGYTEYNTNPTIQK